MTFVLQYSGAPCPKKAMGDGGKRMVNKQDSIFVQK